MGWLVMVEVDSATISSGGGGYGGGVRERRDWGERQCGKERRERKRENEGKARVSRVLIIALHLGVPNLDLMMGI